MLPFNLGLFTLNTGYLSISSRMYLTGELP